MLITHGCEWGLLKIKVTAAPDAPRGLSLVNNWTSGAATIGVTGMRDETASENCILDLQVTTEQIWFLLDLLRCWDTSQTLRGTSEPYTPTVILVSPQSQLILDRFEFGFGTRA